VDPLAVQLEGDGLHAPSGGVLPEDPLYDGGLLGVDLEPGGSRVLGAPAGRLYGDRPVAEDPASGTQAPGRAPSEPPMGLVPEVVQVEFVHQALDGEVHLPARFAGGDVRRRVVGRDSNVSHATQF